MAAGAMPESAAVDPTGRFAYVANASPGSISMYTINATTGALTAIGSVATALGNSAVAVDPSGDFAYVASGGSILTYNIAPSTGLLTIADTLVDQWNAGYLAMTGGNTPVTRTPKFAYAANHGSNVSMYSINATSGALTATGTVAAGNLPSSMAVDPSGRFAYLTSQDPITTIVSVSMYTMDAATGALTSVGTIPASGPGPGSVAVDPSGRFAYVTSNQTSNNLSIFNIDATTGVLSPSATMTAGLIPDSVAFDPSGRSAYVGESGNILVFSIDPTTGALTSTGTTTGGSQGTLMAVHPSGRFAYEANTGPGNILMYTIDSANGALTSFGTVPAGGSPISVAVDPSGRFAYTANGSSSNVSMYTINPATGTLTSIGTIAAGMSPTWVTVDPSGRFVYVANFGGTSSGSVGSVSTYYIDPTTGALTSLGTIPAGMEPVSVVTTGTIQ
jgi:6-phosphogluconolactonase (cycloisomerase 2 family)